MSIESIEIKNILSFESLSMNGFKDMNCIIGANNAGKSNLLRCIEFFYASLNDQRTLPPSLFSNYSYYGTISITYDISRLINIAKGTKDNNYFKYLIKTFSSESSSYNLNKKIKLTLKIYNDNRAEWVVNNRELKRVISDNFPFFCIETRHMNLHKWDDIWDVISSLKPLKISNIDRNKVVDFLDQEFGQDISNGNYKKHINQLQKTLRTKQNTPKEKYLTYIKAGLVGDKFSIDDNDLKVQSDGTNSFHYLKKYLKTIIEISNREYISPIVFVDEPENGLHPKMSEDLIYEILDSYGVKGTVTRRRSTVIFTTHSPNILKETIRSFRNNQSIYLFKKSGLANSKTKASKLNSNANSDKDNILNRFNDNEARLFFSNFILFVEGEAELEIFGNRSLRKHFDYLNKIDIYKCADALNGSQVNPFKTNSSTPFLFLYDADKAMEYTLVKGNANKVKINLRNEVSTIDSLNLDFLKKEHSKYKVGFNEKYKSISSNILFLINSIGKEYNINKRKQNSDNNHKYFVSVFNKYLETKNVRINYSTFEEVLVNENSLVLFLRWLPSKVKFSKNGIIELEKRTVDSSLLSNYIRAYLGGRTDILTTSNDLNAGKISGKKSAHTLILYKAIKNKLFYGERFKKSDGWATSFLDFSISEIEIEAKQTGKSFKELFPIYFHELHDIISRLRPDR